jgi:hypothetical protein
MKSNSANRQDHSNNKPDIIIRDNEKGTCMLINAAISGDRNVIKKDAEKILKYKELTVEIQCMWNVQTSMIPVIIGATGSISKSFRKYLSNVPGKHEIRKVQKTAILGTADILQVGWDGSVVIATRYGLVGSRIESRWGRYFPHLSIPALEPTQPPVQWILGPFPGSRVAVTTHHLAPRLKKE